MHRPCPGENCSNLQIRICDFITHHQQIFALSVFLQEIIELGEHRLCLGPLALVSLKLLEGRAKDCLSRRTEVLCTNRVHGRRRGRGERQEYRERETAPYEVDEHRLECIRACGDHLWRVRVRLVKVLGNVPSIGDRLFGVRVVDRRQRVEVAAIGLLSRWCGTDLLTFILNMGVLNPLGLVLESLEIQDVSANVISIRIIVSSKGGALTESSSS